MRGRELLHPLPLGAIALLVVNDHVLKSTTWAPRALTGKLSDFAGLFFFPILLVAVAHVRPWIAALGTALVFAAIKLEPHANAVAVALLGSCARDPSDLVALPMTALGAIFCVRHEHGEGTRVARTVAMLAASLASVATSRAYRPPCAPVPAAEKHASLDALCARTSGASIVTDGATVSVTLDLTPKSPGCDLRARGFAIDQSPRPELSARTVSTPALVVLDQLDQVSRVQWKADLPYRADCSSLRLGLLLDDAIVDLPIASCGAR